MVTEFAQIREGLFTPAEGRKEGKMLLPLLLPHKQINSSFSKWKRLHYGFFLPKLAAEKGVHRKECRGLEVGEKRRSTTEERPEVEFCEQIRACSDTGRDDRCTCKTTSNFAWV